MNFRIFERLLYFIFLNLAINLNYCYFLIIVTEINVIYIFLNEKITLYSLI